MNLGSIGSPFIHQTSVRLHQVFEKAAAESPAVIIVDEIDSLFGDRDSANHEHKIEEISEFMKLIETASQANILVFGTTNKRYALDDAIMRRGRFDIVVDVDYPMDDEVVSILEHLLSLRPCVGGVMCDGRRKNS